MHFTVWVENIRKKDDSGDSTTVDEGGFADHVEERQEERRREERKERKKGRREEKKDTRKTLGTGRINSR